MLLFRNHHGRCCRRFLQTCIFDFELGRSSSRSNILTSVVRDEMIFYVTVT